METAEKPHQNSGIYNNFEGATIYKLVINGNITENGNSYNTEKQEHKGVRRYSDEQIARALLSINGKDKALNNYQVWLGACCLLKGKYGFPKSLDACCDKIISLPYGCSLDIACKYESIRKFSYLNFVNEDVATWDSYQPKDEEKKLFYGCHQVATELDKALLLEVE